MEGLSFKKAGAAAYASSNEDSSEDEFLRPSTNPAADEFRDYPPRKRRRMHGGADAKEKAALGIFGSDSDDDGPGRRWKSKNLREKGVGFVSEGTREFRLGEEYSDDDDESDGNKDNDAMDIDEEEIAAAIEEEDYDEEEELGGGHRGLGFSQPAKPHANGLKPKFEKTATGPSFQRSAFDSATPFGRGFVPSSAYDPVLRDDLDDTAAPRKAMPSAFSGAPGGKGGKAGKINPKGFGAKMLAKMGYVEGKGLGKEQQGRNIIIEANLRPQGIGLGAVKEKTDQERKEEKRQAKLRGEEVSDSEEEKRKKARKKQQEKAKNKFGGVAGFDSASSTPKKTKTKYMTAEEIKRAAPGLQIPDAFMPILDMTGPGSRLVTSASGLSTPTAAASAAAPESVEAAETRKILRQAHRDLSAFSEEWKSLAERKAWVDRRLAECEQELETLGLDHQRLQDFSDVVGTELPAAGADWPAVIQCLHKAAKLGPETPETAAIVVAALEPFFKDPSWDPLKEPKRYAEDMKGLEALLMPAADSGTSVERANAGVFQNTMDGVFRHHQRSTTPYESLMYKLWLPRALRALRDADIHDPDPLLALLTSWEPLLPPFVRTEFIDNVARRLHTALTDWNPRMVKRQGQNKTKDKDKKGQKQQLPHVWLFPWLPYLPPYHLDPRGTGLVSDVRRKFRTLIDAWPHDQGPIPGLSSWESVLGRSEWRSLVVSHLIPSMARHLERNFRVEPADQEPYLAALDGVLAWEGILPARYVAEVVAGKVFPLWHKRLKEWLDLRGEDGGEGEGAADLGEVADWFEWWGGYFSREVGRLVRGEFERGLLTMEKMLDKMAV